MKEELLNILHQVFQLFLWVDHTSRNEKPLKPELFMTDMLKSPPCLAQDVPKLGVQSVVECSPNQFPVILFWASFLCGVKNLFSCVASKWSRRHCSDTEARPVYCKANIFIGNAPPSVRIPAPLMSSKRENPQPSIPFLSIMGTLEGPEAEAPLRSALARSFLVSEKVTSAVGKQSETGSCSCCHTYLYSLFHCQILCLFWQTSACVCLSLCSFIGLCPW